eukprot:g1911.t1
MMNTLPVVFANTRVIASGVRGNLRRLSTTTFDGPMAARYMKFFNAAESVWKHTEEIVLEAAKDTNTTVSKYVDIASGPGEPFGTVCRAMEASIRTAYLTDGSEAMLDLAKGRMQDIGLTEKTQMVPMQLNDFSPLRKKGENESIDLATAQFALMFTPDFAGALREIDSVLKSDGLLVGTVWEQFDVLTLLGEMMTEMLGKKPPPPPINPLSLKDADYVDGELQKAGFDFLKRHNETTEMVFDMGTVVNNDDPLLAMLIPVTPTLLEFEESGMIPDAINTATGVLRDVAERNGKVVDGTLLLNGRYRYFVAKKRARS